MDIYQQLNSMHKAILREGLSVSFSTEYQQEIVVIVWDPNSMDAMPQCVVLDGSLRVWAM